MRILSMLCAATVCAAALAPSLAAATLPPLETWALQNPVRAKTPINDIDIGADGVGWAAGTVPVRSAYAGGTWQPIAGRATTGVNGVVAVGGASTVVMTVRWSGSSRYLEVSNDGGGTWRFVDTGVDFRACDALFISQDEGWIVGTNGVIIYTMDAGNTWHQQASGTTEPIKAVDFSGGTVFAALDRSLLVSGDWGATWAQRPITGGNWGGVISDIDFVSADVGVVVGNIGVLRTVDRGQTWTKTGSKIYYLDSDLTKVVFKDALVGWIITSPQPWITRDGGVTWTMQYTKNAYRDRYGASMKEPVLMDGHWSPGSSVGWRIAHNGDIFFSADSGKTWYSTAVDSFTNDDLTDITFESATTGFAVTSMGRIWKSTDSGGTWSLASREPAVVAGASTRLDSVVKVPGGRGFAAGSNSDRGNPGVIYRTTSSGTSWSPIYPRVKGIVRDIWTNDGVKVWAVGDKGSLVRSTDGGDSWSIRGAAAAGSAELRAVKVLPNGVGYAVGSNRVVRTIDHGSTWTAVSLPPVADIMSVDVTNDAVWVGTAGKLVYRSVDQGQTWQGGVTLGTQVQVDDGHYVTDISAISDMEAVVVCENALWVTVDGGSTWSPRALGVSEPLESIAVRGDGVWVCGSDGLVLYNAHGLPEYLPPATRIGAPMGWRRQVVDLNLFATDVDGVSETLYRLDGTDNAAPVVSASSATATWQRFSKPRRITKQGKTKVEYLSVDGRGNVERKKTRYIQIDTGKPRIRFKARSSYRRNTVIKVRASDSVSGIKSIVVGVSTADRSYQKTIKSSRGSYRLTRRGTWNLDVIAKDKAGNTTRYRKRIRVY